MRYVSHADRSMITDRGLCDKDVRERADAVCIQPAEVAHAHACRCVLRAAAAARLGLSGDVMRF